MKYLLTIIVILSFCTFGTFVMYHTNRKASSGYDCLYYSVSMGESNTWVQQLMPYCLQPTILETNLSFSDHSYFTFAQLKKSGVTSGMLLDWLAPIDVAEDYEIYLHDVNESNSSSSYRYFNCSIYQTGQQCEYSFIFEYRYDFSSMVMNIFDIKKQELRLTSTVPCYIHLSCLRGPEPLCLDWREICDGKKDCLNGEDEADCWQLETSSCAKNEYQCHNGHCIPDQFRLDEAYSPDCADGSDESDTSYDNCVSNPTFLCEEHTCYSIFGEPQFACGDGQCVSKFDKCANNREDTSYLDQSSSKNNLSDDCWKPMVCLTGYFLDIDSRDCGEFCWGTCARQIFENCPQYIRFPDHAVAFGHVYLVYSKDTVDVIVDDVGDPMFVCYDAGKCANDLQPPTYILDHHCLYYDKLNINLHSVYLWAQKEAIIARAFSSLCEPISESFQCPNVTLYRCAHTKKCISIRRLVDDIFDCEEGDDETYEDSCSFKDSTERFQCSQENKCFPLRVVNDDKIDCKGGDDELHPHKRISQYLITFATICDGFQELKPILIDGKNETDETDCEEWSCNNTYTHCDGIWNCKNGADEIGCTNYILTCPPLHHHCINRTTEQITCLPLSKANDGIIDCLGGLDEIWQCQSLKHESCLYKWQDPYSCHYQSVQIGFRCWNDTKCISRLSSWSEDRLYCPSGEDETNLLYGNIELKCSSNNLNNRTDVQKMFCNAKESYMKWSYRPFQISRLLSSTRLLTSPLPLSSDPENRQLSNPENIWHCHRGVPTLVNYKRSDKTEVKCLCPPSYFGDFCEYQSDRISLSFQIQMSSNWTVIFTFVYFLINDQGEIESYDQFRYISAIFCRMKVNRYLLYGSRPKNLNRSYSVYF